LQKITKKRVIVVIVLESYHFVKDHMVIL